MTTAPILKINTWWYVSMLTDNVGDVLIVIMNKEGVDWGDWLEAEAVFHHAEIQCEVTPDESKSQKYAKVVEERKGESEADRQEKDVFPGKSHYII